MASLASGCAGAEALDEPTLGRADVYDVLAAERAAAQGHPGEAASHYGALRVRHPEDVHVRAREAELLHAAGEEKRAARALEAPELRGTAEAALVRARLAASEGRVDEALRRYAEARRLSPTDLRPLVEAIELSRDTGRVREADALVDAALDAGERLPRGVLAARLRAAVDAKDEASAERVSASLAHAYPAHGRAILGLATATLNDEPALALALLAGLPDTFEVAGAKLAAREALRSRRKSR